MVLLTKVYTNSYSDPDGRANIGTHTALRATRPTHATVPDVTFQIISCDQSV
jgi:hypothetical protein